MNPKFNPILDIMKKYDSSPVGSIERTEYGSKLDKECGKLKERDIISINFEYEKRCVVK